MPTDILLSIVVPVFNVKPYLKTFLDTVLPGLRAECECIFVDDCSTDGSAEIVAEAIDSLGDKSNARLVRHARNKGPGGARNTGVLEARGRYIWFLDSDDVLMSNALGEVLGAISEQGADVIVLDFAKMKEIAGVAASPAESSFQFLTDATYDFELSDLRKHLSVSSITRDRRAIVRYMFTDMRFYAWSHVVRSALCRRFPFPEEKYFEDISVVPLWLLAADGVGYLPKVLIGYRQRPGSILATLDASKYLDMAQAFHPVIKMARQIAPNLLPEEFDYLTAVWIRFIYWATKDILGNGLFQERGVRPAIEGAVRDFHAVVGGRRSRVVRLFEAERKGMEAVAIRLLIRGLPLFILLYKIRLSRLGRGVMFLMRPLRAPRPAR